MNLFCEQVELWQTPTHISYMCYSNDDGGWEGIKYRYIEWVKSHTRGVYETQEDFDRVHDHVNAHISQFDNLTDLEFSIF
tara:strand:+ start:335 stop:574 length:240 start_codon:yes stop_codon:yes gene_type:complete